jgi:hypothetical protein
VEHHLGIVDDPSGSLTRKERQTNVAQRRQGAKSLASLRLGEIPSGSERDPDHRSMSQ